MAAIPKPSLRPGTKPGESVTMPGGEPVRLTTAPEESPPTSTAPPPPAAPEGPSQAQPEASPQGVEDETALKAHVDAVGEFVKQVLPPTADEIAERVVEKIRGRVARQMRDPEAADLLLREVGGDPRAAAAVIGELERNAFRAELIETSPTVTLTQVRKRLPHPPQSLPDGGISLRYNFDPNVNSLPELRIPENAAVRVKTGLRASLPEGWIGEVTVAGVEGQRVQVALLSGEGKHELELMLRTNNPHLQPVRAGGELAQLHLRRREPSKLAFINPHEV